MASTAITLIIVWCVAMILYVVPLWPLTRARRASDAYHRPLPPSRPDPPVVWTTTPDGRIVTTFPADPRPAPYPTEMIPQRFADDGNFVMVHTPAMQDVVRQMAELRKRQAPPQPFGLPEMWEMIGHPELAARERELQRLAREEQSLRRANPELEI